MSYLIKHGERVFWQIRRRLGFRDQDSAPEVDGLIRREIELFALHGGEFGSITRIKKILGLTSEKPTEAER